MDYTEEDVEVKVDNSILTLETFIYGIAYTREDFSSWMSYSTSSTPYYSYEDFKKQQLKQLSTTGSGKQFKIKWFKFKVE